MRPRSPAVTSSRTVATTCPVWSCPQPPTILPFTQIVLAGAEPARRGEIVIFDSPSDGTRLIKRVVAIGGDLVEVRNGRLFINGESLAEGEDALVESFGSRRARLDLSRGGGPDLRPTTVPQGHLLVLGDARVNSRDGRLFGFVPEGSFYAAWVVPDDSPARVPIGTFHLRADAEEPIELWSGVDTATHPRLTVTLQSEAAPMEPGERVLAGRIG